MKASERGTKPAGPGHFTSLPPRPRLSPMCRDVACFLMATTGKRREDTREEAGQSCLVMPSVVSECFLMGSPPSATDANTIPCPRVPSLTFPQLMYSTACSRKKK